MSASESSSLKKKPPAIDPKPARGRFRWRRVIPVAILALCIAVWLTPAIVVRTSLRHRIVGSIFPAYTGQASVGSATLSWTAPVVLHKIVLSDDAGHVWMTIPKLTTSKTLFSLLFEDSTDLGTYTLFEPTLLVEIRGDGSNFEDRLWEILADTGEDDQPNSLTIKIEDGTATWSDPAGGQARVGLFELNATIHQSATAPFPGPVKISARMANGELSGPISLQIDEPPAKELVAKLKADKVPLGTLVPWLKRFGDAVAGTGRLSSDLQLTCDPQAGIPLAVAGELNGQQITAALPTLLGEQRLDLEEIALSGKVRYDGKQFEFEQAVLESPIARVDLTGSIDPAAISSVSGWRQQIGAILADNVNLNGRINLARLPAILSSQLPKGQRIETGRIQFSLRTDGEGGARRGVARVTTTDLVVSLPGEDVTWESPLAMTVILRQDKSGLSAERIHAESDFLKLNGSVTDHGGEVSFEADLNKLRSRLARFLPVDQESLSGRAAGTFRLKSRGEPGLFDFSANLRLRDFQVAWNGRVWSEKDLKATGEAVVALADRELRDIKSGEVTITGAAGDKLSLSLIKEQKPAAAGTWPVAVSIVGDVARWITRLRSVGIWPDRLPWSLGGRINASARVFVGDKKTRVEDLDGAITSFQARNGGFVVAEPKLSVQGDLVYQADPGQAESGTISSENLLVECETFGLRAKSLLVPLNGTGKIRYQGTIRGSLSRLARWILPTGTGIWPTGVVSGDLDLSHSAAGSEIATNLTIAKWELNRRIVTAPGQARWQPVWTDPSVSLQLKAGYDSKSRRLGIETAQWEARGLDVQLAGGVQEPAGRANASIEGNVTYDLVKLRLGVLPLRREDIQIVGAGTRPFSIQGPLRSAKGFVDPSLAAHLRLGWQGIKFRALAVGQGEIDARLQGRALTVATSRVPVAGGSVQLGGQVVLSLPLVARLSSGQIVKEVTITPEMCGTWLSYAAPLLADVTDVEGTFSVDLGAGAVPLLHPAGMHATATLAIEDVEAAPGQIARVILTTVQEIQRIAGKDAIAGTKLRMTAPKQEVHVTVAQGRVHHDRFVMRLGGKDGPLVTTSGSVGFDDTVNLMVTVPLKKEWFKNERVAAVLGGQTLKIPVTGTLSRPVMDPRALRELSRRAAAGALQNLLQRGLEKRTGEEAGSLFQELLK